MKNRMLDERVVDDAAIGSTSARPQRRSGRSVTVNLAGSPLGWLFSRGLVSQRQFDAGERLRSD
jgi:hypothetical protein